MRLRRSRLGVIGLVLLAGCGYSTTSPGTGGNNTGGNNQTGGHTTGITLTGSFTFDPASDTVAVNSTVTWTWPGDGVTHNVTFEDGNASPDQNTGTYQRTFTQTGTYRYRCTHHSSSFTSGSMIGTIVVQ
jgi:plastocyanin